MGPRQSACMCILGSGYIEFDYAGGLPDRYDDPQYKIPKYIIIWGRDPLRSNPDGVFGHAVIDLIKRGTKIINVDPRINWLSTRSDEVLQLRPGTDAAVAFGLLHVIINEDLYDHDFVDKWVYGWDEFVQRVNEFPVEKCAEITGIPAAQFIRVAHKIAQTPVGMHMGLATDQNPNGQQIVQLLIAITCITGNLDVPGGVNHGRPPVMSYGEDVPFGDDLAAKCIGRDDYPLLKVVVNTCHPDRLLYALEADEPYPLRFCWISSNNLLTATNSAQPKRWYDGLIKSEFTVATDVFLNPTIIALADLVLPVATAGEKISWVPGVLTNSLPSVIGAMNRAIAPRGEALSDLEIFMLVGKYLHPENFTDKKWDSVDDYFDDKLADLGVDSFQTLKEEVGIQHHIYYHKHERNMLRSDGKPGFNTTSGKVELKCTLFELFGDDPLPYYEEPRFGPVARPDLAKEYPLTLTTGARHFTSFHSEYRQIARLREIKPQPLVEINPKTAEKYGIKDGDWVVMENPWGSCREVAHLTPIVKEDVIACDHGWWFPEDDMTYPNLGGVWTANCNSLIPHGEIGKMGFGALYKCIPCKIYKYDGHED